MTTETSDHPGESSRVRLVRRTAVLQLKLLADGIRDAVLIPMSLVAALIGLIRGGDNADREFQEVIRLGRRSEHWINLFGHHRATAGSHAVASMDDLISRIEVVLRDQIRKGADSSDAREAVEKALEEMHPENDD